MAIKIAKLWQIGWPLSFVPPFLWNILISESLLSVDAVTIIYYTTHNLIKFIRIPQHCVV